MPANNSNNPPAIPVSFEEAFRVLHEMRVSQAQIETVLRRSLAEQEKYNAHLVKLVEDHEGRLKVLEQFHAVMEATLPDEFVNPAEVAKKITDLESRQDKIERSNASLDKGQAVLTVKLSILVGAAILLAQSVLHPLIKFLIAFFSGGHPS